jgi:hypothetical protein
VSRKQQQIGYQVEFQSGRQAEHPSTRKHVPMPLSLFITRETVKVTAKQIEFQSLSTNIIAFHHSTPSIAIIKILIASNSINITKYHQYHHLVSSNSVASINIIPIIIVYSVILPLILVNEHQAFFYSGGFPN